VITASKPRRWITHFKGESGNVESALVLIPLMILFLSVAQIGLSVYARTTIGEANQGRVAYAALGVPQLPGITSELNSGQPPIALPLPGGGSILVGERATRIPAMTPLLPSGDSFGSTGISVQE
jgi:hypothetical protein